MSETPAEDLERRSRAAAMKVAGAGIEQIAKALGYPTVDQCRDDVISELAARVAEIDDVALEVARLDRLQTGLWPAATAGDTKAASLVLRIIGHRGELLRPRRQTIPHMYEPGCEPAA